MSRNRSWQFTFNNYKAEEYDFLKTISEQIRYMIIGKEIGEKNKTPHLQGYVVWNNAKTMSACKKSLGSKAVHVEIAKGDSDSNIKYCSKEDLTPYTFGEPPRPGTRKDLEGILIMAKKIKDYDKLLLAYAEDGSSLSYQQMQSAQKYCSLYKGEEAKTELIEEFKNSELRDWQKNALKQLEEQDNRQVLWIVDSQGNNGKTYLGKYIASHKDTFVITNGKSANIAYAFNYERYIVFDFVRSNEEYINYGVIEAFKDGYIFSSKYQSIGKRFTSRKVIVFSNFEPDESKLSADRWNIINL